VNLIRRLIDQGLLSDDDGGKGSPEAELGTHAHAALEHAINNWTHPNELVGGWFYDRDLEQETAQAVAVAYEYVKQYHDKGSPVFTELRVGPGRLERADIFGHLDVGVLHPKGTLEIIDYKHGKGVPVSAKNNGQLQIYLIEAQAVIPDVNIEMGGFTTIIQPRRPMAEDKNDAPGIRTVGYTADMVEEARQAIMIDAAATDVPDAPCVPGDTQCMWCRAKPFCSEAASHNMQIATQVFSPVETGGVPAPQETVIQTLTPEQIAHILDHEKMIRSWLDSIHKYALHEAKSGRPIPGWKVVVNTRGVKRKWDFETPEDTVNFLRDKKQEGGSKKLGYDLVSTRLPLSPAQAEKQIKPLVTERMWEGIAKHIITPEGNPSLVPDSDPRPPMVPPADQVFQPVGDESPALPDFLL
jgi:hypothetical protein